MKIFLISFAVFALAIFGMAIGFIVRRRCLRGTCGGLAGMQDSQGHTLCDSCTTPSELCTGRDGVSGQSDACETEPQVGDRSFAETSGRFE